MDLKTLVVVLVTALVSAAATYVIVSRQLKKQLALVHEVTFEKNRNELVDLTRKDILSSDDLANRLQLEYLRGIVDGKNEEFGKFSMNYEPFYEMHEQFMGMRKWARLGYDMQLIYDGLPLGSKTRHVTHSKVEYDQEKIDSLLNSEVASAVNSVCQLVATKGMSFKAIPVKAKRLGAG